jgi:capsule polysaccharide export protein KpsE/RkpR
MKKYNTIMGVFTKTITKLENLATKNADAIATKTARIKVLKGEAQLLDEELTAAMTSAEKIKSFLEG